MSLTGVRVGGGESVRFMCSAVTWAPDEQRPLRGSPCLLGPLEVPRGPGQGRGGPQMVRLKGEASGRRLQSIAGPGEEHGRLRMLEDLELPAGFDRDR